MTVQWNLADSPSRVKMSMAISIPYKGGEGHKCWKSVKLGERNYVGSVIEKSWPGIVREKDKRAKKGPTVAARG